MSIQPIRKWNSQQSLYKLFIDNQRWMGWYWTHQRANKWLSGILLQCYITAINWNKKKGCHILWETVFNILAPMLVQFVHGNRPFPSTILEASQAFASKQGWSWPCRPFIICLTIIHESLSLHGQLGDRPFTVPSCTTLNDKTAMDCGLEWGPVRHTTCILYLAYL
jgi:hypothetical protein